MSSFELPPEERLEPVDLVTEMSARTKDVGPNRSEWPGLTTYRFVRPQPPQWSEVHSLSLCCVVQGRKRVVVDDAEHRYGPFRYSASNSSLAAVPAASFPTSVTL